MLLRRVSGGFVKMVSGCATVAAPFGLAAIAVAVGCDKTTMGNSDDQPSIPTLGETIAPENPSDDDQPIAPAAAEGDLPDVDFSVSPGLCCNPLSIEFNAELSDSTLGGGAVFDWGFGDGRQATGPIAHHTYAWAGEYQVVLEVHLSDGGTATAERTLVLGTTAEGGVEISLSPSTDNPATDEPEDNDEPENEVVADAGGDQEVSAGEIVVLDGSGSTGNGADPLTFSWRQVSGPSVTLDNPSISLTTFTAPSNPEQFSTLVFELTVFQGDASDRSQVAITVSPAPSPVVVAHAGVDQSVESGIEVTLDGSNSSGNGAETLMFSWTQTAGPEVELENPYTSTATFIAPYAEESDINLAFELTVVQGLAEDQDQVTIVVLSAGDPPDEPDEPSEAQILEWMRALEPLPKVHYSFPIESDLITVPAGPMLYEYVRLTHGCSIRSESPRRFHVEAAVQVCQQVNTTNPDIPASIAINYFPWRIVFPSDAPPTDMGPLHDEEIEIFRSRMLQFRQWLAEINEEYQADIEVGALLFDSERFFMKYEGEDDYDAWNEAIDIKHDAFYAVGKEVFPNTRIEWYAQGAIQLCVNTDNWCPKEHFTLQEMADTFNCALYIAPNTDGMVETFRRTAQLADEYGINDISPWVALAAGWQSTGPKSRVWREDWDYDVAYSWHLGAQINDPWYADRPEEYAPWNRATAVLFYPRPFNHSTPSWPRHFIAYVRGAHGIEELP